MLQHHWWCFLTVLLSVPTLSVRANVSTASASMGHCTTVECTSVSAQSVVNENYIELVTEQASEETMHEVYQQWLAVSKARAYEHPNLYMSSHNRMGY
jgi:hypothetical protein